MAMIDFLLLGAAGLGAVLNLWRAARGLAAKRPLRLFAGLAAGAAGAWHAAGLLGLSAGPFEADLGKLAVLAVVLAIAAFGAVE